jgi:hypothetical protein
LGYGTAAQTNQSTGQVTIPANSRLNFIMTLLAFQTSQSVPDLYAEASTGFPIFSGATPSGENDTDFGSVFTGSSATNTFTLGTETTLNFTETPAMVLTGSGASAFTLGTFQLASTNTSGTLPVTFDPTTTGVFNAKLEVFSNDPTNPTYVIKLRGDGVAQAASPSSEDSGFQGGETINSGELYISPTLSSGLEPTLNSGTLVLVQTSN